MTNQLVSDKIARNMALVESIKSELPPDKLKLFEISHEEGASSWLTALPISRQGFMLSKQVFCDALYIRYDFQLKRLPSSCVCGSQFSVEHFANYATGEKIFFQLQKFGIPDHYWSIRTCINHCNSIEHVQLTTATQWISNLRGTPPKFSPNSRLK
jgi:hypothetical protein